MSERFPRPHDPRGTSRGDPSDAGRPASDLAGGPSEHGLPPPVPACDVHIAIRRVPGGLAYEVHAAGPTGEAIVTGRVRTDETQGED